jgi:hypothetical protein
MCKYILYHFCFENKHTRKDPIADTVGLIQVRATSPTKSPLICTDAFVAWEVFDLGESKCTTFLLAFASGLWARIECVKVHPKHEEPASWTKSLFSRCVGQRQGVPLRGRADNFKAGEPKKRNGRAHP